MDRLVLVAGVVAAGLVVVGSCLLAPGPQPRPRIEFQRAQARLWSATPGLRPRISAGGYIYGECGGWIFAVLLRPEPCDQRTKPIAEAALSP